MKIRTRNLFAALALLGLLTLNSQLSTALAQGSAFTYQGQLQNNGAPASGTFNLTFTLFNTNASGSPVAGPVTNNAVVITGGLFTVLIDFGPGVFSGTNYWLEIGVGTNGIDGFTTLTPRQPLAPTPYAIYAESVSAAGITGTLTNTQLAQAAVTVEAGPGLSGGGTVDLGNAIILTNSGVLSVTGDADITATTVDGAVTLGDNATDFAIPSTLVKRDGSGSFSAGSITLGGSLTLPTISASTPDVIYSGSSILFYNDSSGNFYSGLNAGNLATSGDFNTAIGNQALEFDAGGSGNTAVGFGALLNDSSGSDNTAIGNSTLFSNTSGSENTAMGENALYSNLSGQDNVASGRDALFANLNGYQNTANGVDALHSNRTGFQNTANGRDAMYSNTSGANNTAVGQSALYANTSGSGNIALGDSAGNNISTGSGNIDIGNTGLATDTNIIRIGDVQAQTFIAGKLLPPPPVLIQTNFIDGKRYTNNYGWPLTISATVVLNTAGVVGKAAESLSVQARPSVGGFTNLCAISTVTASLNQHFTMHVDAFVPTNAVYYFTNLSTGAGDSAAVLGGQIRYP